MIIMCKIIAKNVLVLSSNQDRHATTTNVYVYVLKMMQIFIVEPDIYWMTFVIAVTMLLLS